MRISPHAYEQFFGQFLGQLDSLSLIMPEPTIVPNKKEVPINSAMFFLYVIQIRCRFFALLLFKSLNMISDY